MTKKKPVKTKSKVAKKSPAAKRDSFLNDYERAQVELLKQQEAEERRVEKIKKNLAKLSFDEIKNAPISNIDQLYWHIDELKRRNNFTFTIKLGSRRYPVLLSNFYKHNTFFGEVFVLENSLRMYDISWDLSRSIHSSSFIDDNGRTIIKRLSDIINSIELEITSSKDLELAKDLSIKILKIKDKAGLVLDARSSVFVKNTFWWGPRLLEMPYGSNSNPRLVVIESDLELSKDDYDSNIEEDEMPPPFLRCFSLDLKRYVFIDIRDVQEHCFQENAIENLVLPKDMKNIITSVFNAKDVFGDLFANRHGGMIILANGGPGLGKTLSAETFAEETKRPLYVLEMGELGTRLEQVEEALQLIFARAARWNTVLLFDEVDIFLSKRTEHDLERNAIVGVFLRLLDQYKGLLFLTTNRAEVIDPAFASRITLRLDYPNLTLETRAQIWKNMFKAANLQLDGNINEVAFHELNGRQIRNVVRLLKATSATSIVSTETINHYVSYSPSTK